MHVDGARTIAEACRMAGVKRLVHFSALNADKDSPSTFLQSKVSKKCNAVHSLLSEHDMHGI